MKTEYYVLQLVTIDHDKPRITTGALFGCCLCGEVISTSGGPGHGSVCIPCGEMVKQGLLRGFVRRKQGA